VAVTGEIDMDTAPALHAALLRALTAHTPTVLNVDLSACTFLDCAGIRVLLAARATAHATDTQMWTRHPQRLVRRVLELTDLLDMFTAPLHANTPATTATSRADTGFADPARLTIVPEALAAAA
jgi:anti-anti-sigma factor